MLSQRTKVIAAVSASVGLHLLLLIVWALLVELLGVRTPPPSPKEPLKVTLETVATPTPTAAPVETPVPTLAPPLLVVVPAASFVVFPDTANMVGAATPPPDARQESDRNTVNAGELPASGSVPIPSQAGRPAPTFALNTAEYLPNPEPLTDQSTIPPPPETAPPLPRAAPQPAATPAPIPDAAPLLRTGDIALATPPPTPEPAPEVNPFDPSFRPPASLTEPPRPTPVSRRDFYQPQPLKTASSGSINNLGEASVASASTPTGRYKAAVKAAVQRRWNGYVDHRMSLMSVGTVTVRFLIGMDGRARGVQVVSNTANETLAAICMRAINEASIPPMPADAVPTTGGGQLPMDLTFEIINGPRF